MLPTRFLTNMVTATTAVLSLLLLLVPSCAGQMRSFVDDHGVEHTTDIAQPTFMTRARNALFFLHHGAGTSQIAATYGLWFNRGSPIDVDNPDTSERYATDPTPEDIEFLRTVPNMSPSCYDVAKGCLDFDMQLFQQLNPKPDFWLFIDNGATDDSDGFFTNVIPNITQVMGKPPIFIDTLFENRNCRQQGSANFNQVTSNSESCYQRSLIDILQRTTQLAEFLGIRFDGSQSVGDGQADMCQAAERFTKVAKSAHERGVRVAEAWFLILPEDIYVAPFAPYGNAFTRTLEELGMPIVHTGYCLVNPCNSGLYGDDYEIMNSSEWFLGCAEGQEKSTCNDKTLYNIDFWMMGGREFGDVQKSQDFFASKFPDKAILAAQYAHVPLNDGAFSYHNIANFLNYIANELEKAQPLYNDPTKCTAVNVTSDFHTSYARSIDMSSVPPLSTACYNESYHQTAYLQCPAGSAPASSPSSSSSSSNGSSLRGSFHQTNIYVFIGVMMTIPFVSFW
ncbi:hypothetical protein ACA910_001615 [Epithemia clementina (nom. ined.)]